MRTSFLHLLLAFHLLPLSLTSVPRPCPHLLQLLSWRSCIIQKGKLLAGFCSGMWNACSLLLNNSFFSRLFFCTRGVLNPKLSHAVLKLRVSCALFKCLSCIAESAVISCRSGVNFGFARNFQVFKFWNKLQIGILRGCLRSRKRHAFDDNQARKCNRL